MKISVIKPVAKKKEELEERLQVHQGQWPFFQPSSIAHMCMCVCRLDMAINDGCPGQDERQQLPFPVIASAFLWPWLGLIITQVCDDTRSD